MGCIKWDETESIFQVLAFCLKNLSIQHDGKTAFRNVYTTGIHTEKREEILWTTPYQLVKFPTFQRTMLPPIFKIVLEG